MKTRMLATAFESGRVGERSAQACGLVSRTMTSRAGGAAAYGVRQIDIGEVYRCCCRKRTLSTDLQLRLDSARIHLLRSCCPRLQHVNCVDSMTRGSGEDLWVRSVGLAFAVSS